MAGMIKKIFEDIPIGGWFYDLAGRNYKKMDTEHAKNIFTFELKDFFPMDEVEIDKESEFKLNF